MTNRIYYDTYPNYLEMYEFSEFTIGVLQSDNWSFVSLAAAAKKDGPWSSDTQKILKIHGF